MDPLHEEIRAQVLLLARGSAGLLKDDTHLIAELGLSSMDLLGLLAFVEERLGVSIPDRELAGLVSIEKILAKVRELQAAQTQGAA